MSDTELDPTMQRLVDILRTAEADRQQEDAPPAEDAPVEERRKGATRMVLADNRAVVAPYGWIAAADVVAFAAHYPAHWMFGWWGPSATVLATAAVVAARTLWHVRASRLARVVKTFKTRRKIVRDARIALAAGIVWELTAANWTPIGPHGLMQIALIGGGLAISAPHLWRNRRQLAPAEPIAEIEPPKEDERLTEFRVHFCQTGKLREARLALTDLDGGFAIDVECSIAYGGTFKDIKVLEDALAGYYDIALDHVSVEPPKNRSNRRARIVILTEDEAHEREERWDGRSTYDPKTGTFHLGRYADTSKSRWQIHAPRSGAAGGVSAGVIGSGKTGTLHVVACETGQAKLCIECLAEASCQQCDRRRIAAIWMGDPQRQPFGVWRGKADLTAWGPLSCVRLLHWGHAAMRSRAEWFGQMEWTDHLGRKNYGKGWFDPSPLFPQVSIFIDEWPMIIRDPELAAFAVPLASEMLCESRKVGIGLNLGTQEADVDFLGERDIREALTAFNTCCHRTDQYAKQMLGIEGNPVHLAPGIPGLSYLNGIDRRSGIRQRVKSIPEYLQPGETGVDVREIAERIAAEPITYDDGVLRAIEPLGYTGPGQVLSDDDSWDLSALMPKTEETNASGGTATATVTQTIPVSGTVSQEDILRVEHTLRQRNGAGSDVFDLMEGTDLSALDVSRAVDVLIAAGQAAQTPSGRYVPC